MQPQLVTSMSGMVTTSRLAMGLSVTSQESGWVCTRSSSEERCEGEQQEPSITAPGLRPSFCTPGRR